jgi:protein-L-isoaspartate(D-aspartate) O-methyltransferase
MARSAASPERLVDQLRRYIGDERVLEAIAATPRDLFVPSRLEEFAWENTALPIGSGQTISQPVVVARMCELLGLNGDEKVLDVGTGSGYHAAVLARLAREVWSIERKESLSRQSAQNLANAGVTNVQLIVGDGSQGFPAQAPYDAINLAAAAHAPPAALEDQLAPGGRLVAPVDGADQRLVLARRAEGGIERQLLEPVRFVPLVGEGPGG